MKDESNAAFHGLIDLAAATFGGTAVAVSDDFFAGKERLLAPGRGIFLPDEYTDRGKWMDGWESRRKRGPGHDWCIVSLGVPGRIRALDIDTNHFLGNHPPYASLEACVAPADADESALSAAAWVEVLQQSPLRPGSQNLFAVADDRSFTHVRLNIFPDGGVARLRVYGDVAFDSDRAAARAGSDPEVAERLRDGEVDLAAAANGGLALACSDMFFGPMNNLIAPGRAENMGGGWETRRKRGPGHDWILVRLGARGEIGLVEIDTNHFKGNFPDRFALRGIDAAEASITELVGADRWATIVGETPLSAHARAFVRDEVASRGPFTHVRLDIFPDGGVSRLRVFGRPTR